MRLKKIKLAGFKSFVDPTTVPFTGNLTAIVGPNGCGKSNVIDAVRWVLGESSAKHLRGGAMTDVIFNGSSQRKPIAQASVELIFDNSEGRMGGSFAQYNEVSVKRHVNRDAQVTYFLNGTKCRKRDITDLFLGTGLGPRSYAIIEQGMISRLIESRPQELRVYIEEAAGISKYKERRRETENRLRHTRENLERLLDVREELGAQLEKLQRQAAAAQRYRTLRSEERQLKAELATIRYLKLQQQIDASQHAGKENQQKLTALQSQYVMLDRQQTEAQTQLAAQQQTHEHVQQQLFQLGNQIARTEQQILHEAKQKQHLQQQLEQVTLAIQEQTDFICANGDEAEQLETEREQYLLAQEELAEQIELVVAQTEQVEHELEQWNAQWQQASGTYTELQKQLAQLQSKQQLTEQLRARTLSQQASLQSQLAECDPHSEQVQLAEIDAELDALLEMIDAHEAELLAVQEHKQQLDADKQQLQQQLRDADERLNRDQAKAETLQQWVSQQQSQHHEQMQALGIDGLGPITKHMVVEKGWEKATETVLQQVLQAETVDTLPVMEHAPTSQLALVTCPHSSDMPDVVAGTLAEKLTGHPVIQRMVAQVYLADTDADAMAQLEQLPTGGSVVCKAGIWRGDGWVIYPGEARGELVSRQELEQLWEEIEQRQAIRLQLNEQLFSIEAQRQHVAQQLEQFRQHITQTKQQLAQQQQRHALLQQQYQTSVQRQQTVEAQLHTLEQQRIQQTDELEHLAESLLEMEAQDDAALAQQQQLQQGREEHVNQLSHHRAQLDRVKADHHKAALHIEGVSERIRSLGLAKQRAQTQLATLAERKQQFEDSAVTQDDPQLHQQQLEAMLQTRLEREAELADISNQISVRQQQLIEFKQRQQQILTQQQQLRDVQSSLSLEQEGLKVRAQGQLELLEELEVILHNVIEQLSGDADEAQYQASLDKIARAIARLGAINLAAIDEYEQQAERKRYLDGQHEDLSGAIDTLESAIRRIDRECKTRFKDTFDKVNADLKQLFPKVFGGGSAYLELTDDDLLETGVTIMARPPGKRNATIQLLSGGEKALTALSLVFAIFRLNPAPFCMLDEVDAPLDDANVGRYCNLVKEMSNSVQFIYISHNKVSMEMAEQLSGVTMLEPGVSRLVSVDVDEAVALAELS